MRLRTRLIVVTAHLVLSVATVSFAELTSSLAAKSCCAKTHNQCAGLKSPDDCCKGMGHSVTSAPAGTITDKANGPTVVLAAEPVTVVLMSSADARIRDGHAAFARQHDPPHLHTFPLLIWFLLRRSGSWCPWTNATGGIMRERILSLVGLTSSLTTLVCWMLPIVLVSLGLGSVIVSAIEYAPWLVTVSRHKGTVFVAVGALLALNYWLAVERPRRLNCAPGEICHVDSPPMRLNRVIFWSSAAIYAAAVAATYLALLWLRVRS